MIIFNDHSWSSRCDYLFFRNNVPDTQKLRKNLTWKKGGLETEWAGFGETLSTYGGMGVEGGGREEGVWE